MGTDEVSGAREVISRDIKPGRETDYDEWFRSFLELKKKTPGYLSTTQLLREAATLARAASSPDSMI